MKTKRPTLKLLKKIDKCIPDGEGAAYLQIYCDNSWCVALNFQGEEFATLNGSGQVSTNFGSQWEKEEEAILDAAWKIWIEYYPCSC